MTTISARLSSLLVTDFMDAVSAIRSEGNDIAEADFRTALGVFHLYRKAWSDLQPLMQTVLEGITKHQAQLDSFEVGQVVPFLKGYLRGGLDKSGYVFLAASVELAAHLSLKNIRKGLNDQNLIEDVEKLAGVLRKVEGTKHDLHNYIFEHPQQHMRPAIEELLPSLDADDREFLEHALSLS
jgi:hypothetical protein